MQKLKRTIILLALLLPLTTSAQEKVVVVDDEACGCELYFIDGIQTIQRDGLFGFKREDGTVFVEAKYKFVDKFHGDYCIVYYDYGVCGLIDRQGRTIIPVQYANPHYLQKLRNFLRYQCDLSAIFGVVDNHRNTYSKYLQ